MTAAEELPSFRSDVLNRSTGWDATYGQYTKRISQAFGAGGALTGMQDAVCRTPGRDPTRACCSKFSRAGEMLARENTALAGARLTGALDGERLRLFTGAVDTRRTLTEAAVADLRGPERAAWRSLEE
ncbi:nitrate- and nitrite sensing domain-containing protein [Streptomyces sp. NPDC003379]